MDNMKNGNAISKSLINKREYLNKLRQEDYIKILSDEKYHQKLALKKIESIKVGNICKELDSKIKEDE